MTMIEKMAAAMRATSGGQPFTWENAARAALEAIREPDDKIFDGLWSEHGALEISYSEIWRTAIDAALSEVGIPTTEQNQAVTDQPHHLADRMG